MEGSVRHLDIVWFIGVMCVMQTLAQVCPYSDPGCTCGGDNILCSNLQQIPPLNTGVNVRRITQLSIQKGNITTIPNNSLPPGLTSIYLIYNPITDISDDAFATSAETLQSVYISKAKFNNFPTALTKLTALTHLSIYSTIIQDWDAATLKQIAATLENLELMSDDLSLWPRWISDFHLLRSIDLSFNSFESIPNDAFNSIKDSLTDLYLESTGLTQVPHALSVLSSLDTLVLSYNKIVSVSEIEKITRFPFSQKLSFLSLVYNGMTRTANFSNLTSLRFLRLDQNRITDVPAGSLPASLTSLDFSDNRLSSVPQDVASMSQLSDVDLSGNLITRIEPNSFPPSVKHINLSSNKITIITNSTLRNLNLLSTLVLDDNPISTITTSAFSDMESLFSLSLTNSDLTEIPIAFTLLKFWTELSFTTSQPLSCPCPAPPKLVQWFSSFSQNSLTSVICSNGQSVTSYLSGQCGQPTSAT